MFLSKHFCQSLAWILLLPVSWYIVQVTPWHGVVIMAYQSPLLQVPAVFQSYLIQVVVSLSLVWNVSSNSSPVMSASKSAANISLIRISREALLNPGYDWDVQTHLEEEPAHQPLCNAPVVILAPFSVFDIMTQYQTFSNVVCSAAFKLINRSWRFGTVLASTMIHLSQLE